VRITERTLRSNFVARSFARELDVDGATTESVTVRLRQNLDPVFHPEIEALRAVLDGKGIPPERSLKPILAEVRNRGGNVGRAYAAVHRALVEQSELSAMFYRGVWEFVAYIAATLVVLTIVVMIFATFVLPGLDQMYRDFDQEMPTLTSAVLLAPWLPIAAFLAVLVLAFCVPVAVATKRRHATLQALGDKARRVPLFGEQLRLIDEATWMRHLGVMMASGLSFADAEAATRVCIPGFSIPAETELRLRSADRLGAARQEVDQLIAERGTHAWLVFGRFRRAVILAVRLLVYLIVATFIIAMYLPIFKLGSLT
jgi:hypothetical protein